MLNDEQQAAVDEDGNCVVFAPPGSGKTMLLASKCARLLRKLPADNSVVVAATFSRDGAFNLRKRTLSLLGEEGKSLQKRFVCNTFHALAIYQLQHNQPSVRVLRPLDQVRYAQAAAQRSRYPAGEDLPSAVEHIAACKSSMTYDRNADPHPDLLECYSGMLVQDGVIDLSDVLLMSIEGMRDEHSLVKPYAAPHLLVDEAQDTDEVQFSWLREHVRHGSSVTLVGDDDQTVYSWRRALGYEGMRRFTEQSRARTITLVRNYRSRPEIVASAGMLIKRNQVRQHKAVIAEKAAGGSLFVLGAESARQEACAVAGVIDGSGCVTGLRREEAAGTKKERRVVRPESWAVMARSNTALAAVERALSEFGIPYTKRGPRLWEADPVYGTICLLAQPDSMTALRSFMSGLCFKADDVEAVVQSVQSASTPGVLVTEPAKLLLTGSAGRLINAVLSGIEHIWCQLRQAPSSALSVLRAVITSWLAMHSPERRRDKTLDWRLMETSAYETFAADLDETLNSLEKIVRESKRNWRRNISQLVDRPLEGLKPKECVQLLTLHASKGLEFERVWITGAHEGSLPSRKSLGTSAAPRSVEEERRLFYVGMTRAKSVLYVSYLQNREPSPFLAEAELQDRALWQSLAWAPAGGKSVDDRPVRTPLRRDICPIILERLLLTHEASLQKLA